MHDVHNISVHLGCFTVLESVISLLVVQLELKHVGEYMI